MKFTKRLVSLFLAVLMMCGSVVLSASVILPVSGVEASNVAIQSERNETVAKSITAGAYKTYTASDTTMRWTVPNRYAPGTNYNCTSMQGLNVGTTYAYTAKIYTGGLDYAVITRTNMNSGQTTAMNYYSSVNSTTPTACTTIGHANDLVVCGISQNNTTVNYMYVATMQKGTAITRMKINGTGVYLTGFFDLRNSSNSKISATSIKTIANTGGYLYFLIKTGLNFYYCRISNTAAGGTASNPTAVTCYKVFTIDTRNAIFAKSGNSYGTLDNMENWTNQGFAYSGTEGAIYVPVYNQYGNSNENAILIYNVSGLLNTGNLQSQTTDINRLLFPCTVTFRIQFSGLSMYEIESCGFRTGQSSSGDLKLYYNTNSTSTYEGISSVNFNRNTHTYTPVADDNSIVYKVTYNGNGGTVPSDTANNFKMYATTHVNGIGTRLRVNTFEKSGSTFAGWYLKRSSDNKWLYFDADGSARWYLQGSQPVGATLALYANTRKVSQLTTVDNDTITCYAQWTPNATGTKSYYLQYNANGGTGTMADTKVVYGQSTTISQNAFTRSGYVFSGWIAHRRSDNKFIYKNKSTLADSWQLASGISSNYFLKAYTNRCKVAATTSVDRDIVTLYAVWTKVQNPVYPTTISAGTSFNFGGTIDSDAGLYNVTAKITNSSGAVCSTFSASPKTNTYSLAAINGTVKTNTLSAGTYTYTVTVKTMNSSSAMTTVTLLNVTFRVT